MAETTLDPRTIYTQEVEYLVFQAGPQLFAIPYVYLVSILDSPTVTPVPNTPRHVRGAIDFDGQTIPLYDTRIKMGLPPLPDEIRQITESLQQRKQDHLNWLNRLKEEVHDGQAITVETNPHRCAFGCWYDGYRPDNQTLRAYMAEFDEPHRNIHRIAEKAKEYIRANNLAEARELIARTEETELQTLVRLFDGATGKIKNLSFEYAVVIDFPGHGRFALCADGLKHFDRFAEVIYPLPPVFTQEKLNFIDALGRQRHGENSEDVLIINLELFLKDLVPAS